MRTSARASRKPRALLRGRKLVDGISGEEIYEGDSTTRLQRGMFMHKRNFDTKTTEQMDIELERAMRR